MLLERYIDQQVPTLELTRASSPSDILPLHTPQASFDGNPYNP